MTDVGVPSGQEAERGMVLRMAWRAMLGRWFILAGLLASAIYIGPGEFGFVALGLGALVFLSMGYSRISQHALLASDHIEYRNGIFWPKESQINLAHVRLVDVQRTPVGLLLNYGDISIASAGTGEAEIRLKSIHNAKHIKTLIRSGQNTDRQADD